MKSVLVVGYGSIGSRHARLLAEHNVDIAVTSRQKDIPFKTFRSLEDALATANPSHVIIANETSQHEATLRAILNFGFKGRILIEKPLFHRLPDPELKREIEIRKANIFVAYNLRFHPILQKLHQEIAMQKIINATIYAGQDLRTWRPGRNFKQSYSASKGRGGGVLRDLSHELDYAGWLFGDWQKVAAVGGQEGPLALDADDCWGILMTTAKCASVSIQLDYYHRPGARRIIVNTYEETIEADLVEGTYRDASGVLKMPNVRDQSYWAQLQAFLSDQASGLCNFDDAVKTMRLIETVEESAREGIWVRQ